MLNTIKNNILFLLGGFIALFLAWITGTGAILNYVPFADPLNEMAFFCMCIVMASCSFCCIKL